MAYSDIYANFFSICQKANQSLGALWRLLPVKFYLLALLFFQAFSWWGAYHIYSSLTGDILVLHYNVDFGIDLVGAPVRIFSYPLFGLGIVLLNAALAASFSRHRDFRVFSHLLLGAAICFNFILNIALFFIYLINFR